MKVHMSQWDRETERAERHGKVHTKPYAPARKFERKEDRRGEARRIKALNSVEVETKE